MTADEAQFFQTAHQPWFAVAIGNRSWLTDMVWALDREIAHGFAVRILRGKRMRTFDRCLQEFAAALQFPYYFGNNFNALTECLSDLEWLNARGFVLAFEDGVEVMADEPTQDRSTLWRIVGGVASEWGVAVQQGEAWDRPAMPFHAVLHSEPQRRAELDELIESNGITARAVWG